MPPAFDEEEGMGPLEKGRHRYQKKNYQGALTALTEAVKISTGHLLLTALDHRAATYEKLDQLQSALKDAKEMLELKPELSKGYLRCGKVLQLKGEHQLALKIYERGLRKVKVDSDKDRLTLQSMFNKLQKSLAPSKTLDPLSYLPFELAEMIAQQLSIRERVYVSIILLYRCSLTIAKDLFECQQVMENNLIESIPNIQVLSLMRFNLQGPSPLDLSGPLKGLEAIELITCDLRRLPLLPRTLKRLNLSDNLRLSSHKDDAVDFPFLETLTCHGTGLSDEWLVSLLQNARKLTHLDIGSRLVGDYAPAHRDFPVCENVHTLSLAYLQYAEAHFMRVVEKCPNLKTLIICGTKITGVAVRQFVAQGVTFLDVKDCDKISTDAVEYARGKGVEVKFNFTENTARLGFRDRLNGL